MDSCLCKNTDKTVAENIRKYVSNKYSRKLLDHAKKCTTDPPKTASKEAIQKTIETTCVLICNRIADKIRKVSRKSPHNK